MSFIISNKSGETTALFVTMELVHCCNCGVAFAMPTELDSAYRKNHKMFYCPNGHGQHYTGKTEAEKLKEELEKERSEKEHQKKCRVRAEEMYRKSDIERKKVKTRLKNVKEKISEGLCPCCEQGFPNLHEHMASAHPEFKNDPE